MVRDKHEERDSSDARRAGKAGLTGRTMVQGPKFEVSGTSNFESGFSCQSRPSREGARLDEPLLPRDAGDLSFHLRCYLLSAHWLLRKGYGYS